VNGSGGNGWSNTVLASSFAGTSAAIENVAGTNMNILYKNASGQLADEYWVNGSGGPNGGWWNAVLASGIAGTPTAIENTSETNINVFYKNTSSQLADEYLTDSGWANAVLQSGIAGTPAAIENGTETNINVLYRNTSDQLADEYLAGGNPWANEVLTGGMVGP
jgi:hypothetical protein